MSEVSLPFPSLRSGPSTLTSRPRGALPAAATPEALVSSSRALPTRSLCAGATRRARLGRRRLPVRLSRAPSTSPLLSSPSPPPLPRHNLPRRRLARNHAPSPPPASPPQPPSPPCPQASAEAEQSLQEEQALANALASGAVASAFRAALALRRPRALLTVLQGLPSTDAADASLRDCVRAAADDDLAFCLECSRDWQPRRERPTRAAAPRLHALSPLPVGRRVQRRP